MYIIISCFVRKRKREEREREREKEDCSVLSNRRICPLLPSSSSSFFLGSFENRTEKEKTQLIGGIYRFEKFAGHVRQGSSKEKEKSK